MRPGAEKRDAHGLFNEKDEPIVLDRVANDIFGDELKSIYQKQTASRDELKVLSEAEFKRMVRGIQFGDIDDPQLDEAEPQEEATSFSENDKLSIERLAHNNTSIVTGEPEVDNTTMLGTVFALFVSLSRCIEDDYTRKYKEGKAQIDKKLQRIIQRKKQELGERKVLDFTIS